MNFALIKKNFAGRIRGLRKPKAKDAPEPDKPVRVKDQTPLFGGLSLKEKTLFAKRLSFLVKAGVPILESLHILRDQMKRHRSSKIFESLIVDVQNGKFLHTSMAKFERVFGGFAINIIKVGETSGVLSENLTYLAEELRKRDALKKKVLGSLVYPIFITIATLGVSALLTAYIFPKILPIFSSLNVELPITTRILLSISNFLRDYGLLTLAILIVAMVFMVFLHRRLDSIHKFFDRILLRTPIAGRIALNFNLANFSRTVGILLKGGMTLTHALEITGDTTANKIYKTECYKMAEAVRAGGRVSTHLEKNSNRFPSMLSHMVSIGEKTGSLSETFIYLSEMYENEVEEMTKNLSNSIEPVLMVFMGVIVGFVAVSVIAPIYEVTQSLQR